MAVQRAAGQRATAVERRRGPNGVLRLHASLADSTQAGGEVWRGQRTDTNTGFE